MWWTAGAERGNRSWKSVFQRTLRTLSEPDPPWKWCEPHVSGAVDVRSEAATTPVTTRGDAWYTRRLSSAGGLDTDGGWGAQASNGEVKGARARRGLERFKPRTKPRLGRGGAGGAGRSLLGGAGPAGQGRGLLGGGGACRLKAELRGSSTLSQTSGLAERNKVPINNEAARITGSGSGRVWGRAVAPAPRGRASRAGALGTARGRRHVRLVRRDPGARSCPLQCQRAAVSPVCDPTAQVLTPTGNEPPSEVSPAVHAPGVLLGRPARWPHGISEPGSGGHVGTSAPRVPVSRGPSGQSSALWLHSCCLD